MEIAMVSARANNSSESNEDVTPWMLAALKLVSDTPKELQGECCGLFTSIAHANKNWF